MRNKWLLGTLSAITISSMALAGCSSSTSSSASGNTNSASTVPQEITYATTTDAVGLSPIQTNDNASAHVIDQVYETLFKRNPQTMAIEPDLAVSYTNPDPLTWIIKLRKGVKFQDGTPFNADAVKYDFDKFRDPKTAAPRASLLASIDTVTVQDPYTVVIKTKKPYGALLAALSHDNASIVSPKADKAGNLNKQPVGTGPFKFVEWVPGDHITLAANKDYWGGTPKLQKVTFKVVPDVNTEVSMLQSGQVQFIDNLAAETLPRLQSMSNVSITKKDGTPMYYFGFNMDKAPMNNLKFRQAAAYAIDRSAYVKQLGGLGIQSNSIIGPKVFGYDPSAEKEGYNFDPAKAKQLLKESGYNGAPLKMLVANTPGYVKMAQIVQAQLKQVGINAQISLLEWGTFLDVSKKGDFDLTFLAWTNSTADGSELLYPNLDSKNINASNVVRYNNPAFDKLVEASRETVDQNQRKTLLDEANKMAINDAPMIVMNHAMVSAAVDKSVKGFKLDPTGQWFLNNVTRE
ncbi:glutathione ABC transporter substrate-binding protein [Heyndrickxia acidicola]|uniref:Glutathione ABC transporter substrate-binding protein n=1 Tax=Heyndrickxia acidicola TaxID=209389 RepID=A0ABU6MFC7_9BACI|nr:glutathione ABC transporter substrate-binding protein [Heyndrickxia acidicola]MED1202746.1 glutathione ABC transporter substrate-binding protein [Heyndrickxia acidicola]